MPQPPGRTPLRGVGAARTSLPLCRLACLRHDQSEAPAREAMKLDTLSQPRAASRRSRRAERRIRRPAPLRCPGGEDPPPTPPTCAPPARPTEAPAREAVNSEQKAGQGAAGLGDSRVAGREHLEQPDQVQPDLVPVLAGGAPDNAEQPVERLFVV